MKKTDLQLLKKLIEEYWEDRAKLNSLDKAKTKENVMTVLESLDNGSL